MSCSRRSFTRVGTYGCPTGVTQTHLPVLTAFTGDAEVGWLMQTLLSAVLYFVLVFGAGFVLGIGRVLVIVPLLGERTAELLEMPLMLGVTVVAARWIVRHRMDDPRLFATLSVGFIALGILLIAELAVGVWLRGMSVAEVFLNRDPVSGTTYYMSLLLFAVMPTLIIRFRRT